MRHVIFYFIIFCPNEQCLWGECATRLPSFVLFSLLSRPRAGLATRVCMYGHTYSRVWINRVRLPTLLVVSWKGKMNISLSAFAPENVFPRDGFDSPVPRQPARLHTQAESGASLRDSSRVPRRHPFVYLKPPYAPVPSLSGHAIAYR